MVQLAELVHQLTVGRVQLDLEVDKRVLPVQAEAVSLQPTQAVLPEVLAVVYIRMVY